MTELLCSTTWTIRCPQSMQTMCRGSQCRSLSYAKALSAEMKYTTRSQQNGSGPGSATVDLPPEALPAAEASQEPAPEATVDMSDVNGEGGSHGTGGDGGGKAESAAEHAVHETAMKPVEKVVDAIGTKVGVRMTAHP